MRPNKLFAFGRVGFVVLVVLALAGNNFAASQETLVYSFLGAPDGSEAGIAYGTSGGLVADRSGNLYGTTYLAGCGKREVAA
jgi:hypothetical protein